MAKKKWNFTYDGKAINGRFLCAKIGISSTHLYYIANRINSADGNKIEKHNTIVKKSNGKMIDWEGERVPTAVVANELGLKKPTLDTRLRLYGPDCDLAYFPGTIPRRLRKKSSYKPPTEEREGGDLADLSNKDRSYNLKKIRLGMGAASPVPTSKRYTTTIS